MRWDDERYVRVYTRDTSEWVALSWEARAAFLFLLRKADRAGIIPLGKKLFSGLAVLLFMPADVLERAVMELAEDGCILFDGEKIVVRNFIDAQEVPISDAARKREQRTRDRAKAMSSSGEHLALHVTKSRLSVTASRGVTSGHDVTHAVTPNLAVPNRTEPCLTEPNQKEEARSREVGELSDAVADAYQRVRGSRYLGHAKDIDATSRLAGETTQEIVRRFERALKSKERYPKVATLYELAQNWGHFDKDTPPNERKPPQDVRKGVARADEQDWSNGGGFDAPGAKP